MKITLGEAITSLQNLSVLGNTDKINAKTSYDIAKTLKIISEEVKIFYEVRTKKLNEAASKDTEGKPIIIKEDYQFEADGIKKEKVLKEIEDLKEKEIEIKVNQIKIADLGSAEIKPVVLSGLLWLIIE